MSSNCAICNACFAKHMHVKAWECTLELFLQETLNMAHFANFQ